MTLGDLDNLVKIKQLKLEQPNQLEFDGLVNSGVTQLKDSRVAGLSDHGRFTLAYGAAHAFALAALRWHGYRSDNRYLVFQCLQYTAGLENAKWRVLDKCHKQRNIAEYEGHLEITPGLLQELVEIAEELLNRIKKMGPVRKR